MQLRELLCFTTRDRRQEFHTAAGHKSSQKTVQGTFIIFLSVSFLCSCARLSSAYLLNPLLWLLSKDSQRSRKVISKRALRRIIQLSLLKDLQTSPPLSFLHSVPHLWHVAFSAQDDNCVHTHQHLQNNQSRHTCQHLKTHVWVIPHGKISCCFFFFF